MQILKDEIREKIENAAIEVFLEKGFIGASMQKVAARAGVSVSNIYNYFESKEKLFAMIVDPVNSQINQLLEKLLQYEIGKSFADRDFIAEFIRTIAIGVGMLIKKNRRQLLLVFDKSYGTKYEHIKEKLIGFLEEHFINSLEEQPSESAAFIMHISATNLVEGILEIVRHYRSDAWVDSSLNEFIRCHICGLAQFFA
ncbi:MAG TPA: TetR/AcrR family transcriptional regulator [Bacillota bacterium]